ncbi:hypothetical protein ACFQ7B_10515 [Streptomyces erythrochromogenes]|uniref:hypothetical protein n=1 Tax=Streptomyces erythrochromogenes TaxID=285574 RepID=UPI0036CA4722
MRVPGPGPAERLVAAAPHWIGAPGEVTEDLVTIEPAALPQPWRPNVAFPQRADFTAALGVRSGTWRIAPAK